MDSAAMNRYEQQLYSVFKTFDVDNEEALDRRAVLDLCDALQLDDRGAALADTLFERRADRVTFAQFRNGLLSVLGSGDPPASPALAAAPAPAVAAAPAPAVAAAGPPPSDDDSSGREVAPKFVFGSKKYGRRSRPPHPAPDESPRHRVSSDSRLDGERARQRMRCKRSASAMESRDARAPPDDDDPPDLDHDRRVDRDRALALCRGLRMPGIDRRLVDRVFDEDVADEISVGDFFDRLNASLTTSVAEALDGPASPDGPAAEDAVEVVAADDVVDAWEGAGVRRPRRLLVELGFGGAALRPPDLERALDDELRALAPAPEEPEDARALLLAAAHALAALRLDRARRRRASAAAERDKLRADLAEANRRARLLAQDVDESHARIEAELKASLRQVEARHAEAARVAAAEAAAERERAASARARLEAEVTRRAEAETRLRGELGALRERVSELRRRAAAGEERAAAAERERARAAEEARARAGGEGGAAAAERAAAGELAARLDDLRLENQLLRDRNDELCAALEAAGRPETLGVADATASWREEAAAATPGPDRLDDRGVDPPSLLSQGRTEEGDSSLASVERSAFGPVEAARRLREMFDEAGGAAGCEGCAAVERLRERARELADALLLSAPEPEPEAGSHPAAAARPEAPTDSSPEPRAEIGEEGALRERLAEAERRHAEDNENLTAVIKELESSLEQMKAEYDKCEEYWAGKLEAERQALGEEQRAGDERLAELAAKIAEYERQFEPRAAPPPPLPTIHEKYGLELQFADLEDEFAKYRRDKEAELAEKMDEIARLVQRVEETERRVRELEVAANATGQAASPASPAGPAVPSTGPPAPHGATGTPGTPTTPTDRPVMLHCAELEGRLRRQAQENVRPGDKCACACWREWRAGGAGGVGGAAGAGGLGGAEVAAGLRARAARAERAAHRLHARLAAADLLVKDLYLENCRLAHAAPLPHLPYLP